MRLSLLPLVALAGSAFASGDSISGAIDNIANATLALNKTIATWPETLIGTLPITTKSTLLLAEIHRGTVVARASEPLSLDETLQVAKATAQLGADVNITLETVIAAKPSFDKLLLTPVILLNLELQRNLSIDFSEAVVSKVPADLQDKAKALVQGIDDSFAQAIDKYTKKKGLRA